MKIKNKLLLFLIFFAILLGAILGVNTYINNSNTDLYLINQKERLNLSAEKAIKLNNEQISSTVYDYTFWDDYVKFISSKDTIWAEELLLPTVSYKFIDYLWTYNLKAQNIYSVEKEDFPVISDIINPEYIYQLLDTVENSPKHFTEFYVKKDTTLFIVSGGTIHISDDIKRLQKPHGFLLLGKIIDNDYFTRLGVITNSKVSFLKDLSEYNNKDKYSVFSIQQLKNEKNEVVAYLLFEREDIYLSKTKENQNNVFTILLILVIISVITVAIMYNIIFTKPFNAIIESLDNQNIKQIKPYLHHTNEWGKLSDLIEKFFIQKGLLINEIEERKEIMEQVAQKNAELESQNEEILTINDELNFQKEIIQKAHKNITDSINYAKTIQEALLTSNELIGKLFKEFIIINKPKDVVSGDFYYINNINDHIIFAVGDCTGHGVPGGFMTMLGITYLHEIARRKEITSANEVLNILRKKIKATFTTFGTENQNGLDIAYCSVNPKTNILQFSGANRPLVIIRNKEILIFEHTKNPIGFYKKEIPFINHEIQLLNNDIIYLFSDGYQDQPGGIHDRKLTSKRFRELLLQISDMPLNNQKEILESFLEKWKGKFDQVDDIAIMAVKWTM
jgi:serine phosphatase RsbU (regulator of sigma subunit)